MDKELSKERVRRGLKVRHPGDRWRGGRFRAGEIVRRASFCGLRDTDLRPLNSDRPLSAIWPILGKPLDSSGATTNADVRTLSDVS